MFKKILTLAIVFISLSLSAQETIKTMVYNLLEFPSAFPPNRAEILKDILDEYEPDIFMICELETEAGANLILNTALNDEGNNYVMAPFEPSQSGDPDHQQLIFYRKGMFSLAATEVLPTPVRDINHYTLKLSTADQQADPVLFEIFVTHLKSSTGTANKQLRLEMVQEFTNRLESLDPNAFVIFAGDFNLYTASEPAYIELLDPTNAIVMVDPINSPGSWNNNINFQDIHTQSTRISSGPFGAGAGGGLDDRFDFIVISENMQNDPKLNYIADSYKSFGNNGNCYDNSINSPDCFGDFGQTLRNNLYNMSDHLPIVMNLQTNKQIVLNIDDFIATLPIELENTVVTDKLNFRTNSNFSGKVSFEIYNVLGQKLLESTLDISEFKSINVSQLSNGIYYLKTNLPASQTFKFLKTF
ncbi:T9SS type A sorting domain-containing protein [Aequorivita sp. SDUM287046]|uniref:T9SS type A sorting domain-containing protein n=1 Tax=Aequorivita aurantiaca TaxID=3053356 RepID=A0ABT8DG71_9FLAO|nr:T9SS type A sorting domain-containing protein [Aequorivita aurantiaca]MDN3723659.1 T9SS type A sorting domain-containing protein [Aequorivita aurantiaca]